MNLPAEQENFWVSIAQAGQRIDKLLAEFYPDFSRTYFQRLIEDGFVLLNGQPIKKRILPEAGDEIEVCFQLSPDSPVEPEAIPLQILFEDEHLIAVNKPAGMVVHPAPGHRSGTFVNALLAHCEQTELRKNDPLRPGIVHRLDKDTSGVLLAAKTPLAHQRLVEGFAQRRMKKTYLAFCSGRPMQTLIDAPISRHPTRRKEMAIVEGGKEAITHLEVLAFDSKISLILIKPLTGRTHQIRVHLKHIGHPILGDSVYGSLSAGIERQLLHAYRLDFTHPISQSTIQLAAPLPDDMKAMITRMKDAPAIHRAVF